MIRHMRHRIVLFSAVIMMASSLGHASNHERMSLITDMFGLMTAGSVTDCPVASGQYASGCISYEGFTQAEIMADLDSFVARFPVLEWTRPAWLESPEFEDGWEQVALHMGVERIGIMVHPHPLSGEPYTYLFLIE